MIQINRASQTNSTVLSSALAGLSKKIAPLVQAELVGVLIAELERHFNEKLLTDLQQRVEAQPYMASAWALGAGFLAGILLMSLVRNGRRR